MGQILKFCDAREQTNATLASRSRWCTEGLECWAKLFLEFMQLYNTLRGDMGTGARPPGLANVT